jgi:sugar phosphate isomerase/epimerase
VFRLRIALQLASLPMSFRHALAAARQIGVEAVEIDARGEVNPTDVRGTALRQVRKLLDDQNLRVAALEFRTRHGYHEAEGLDRRIQATKDAMEFAHALGATVVTNHIGPISTDDSTPEWKTMVEALTDLALHSQRSGAMLSALAGTDSGASLRKLLDALPPGLIGVTLDPGMLIARGFEPLEVVEAVGSAIVHAHADDAIRERTAPRGTMVQLGRGSVDYPALLGALEERQYRGYLSIRTSGTGDAATELSDAVKYLRRL